MLPALTAGAAYLVSTYHVTYHVLTIATTTHIASWHADADFSQHYTRAWQQQVYWSGQPEYLDVIATVR